MTVTGWAVDPRTLSPGEGVLVSADTGPSDLVAYGLARPDVAAAISPNAVLSGFKAVVAAAGLKPGQHVLHFVLVAADGQHIVLPTVIRIAVR